MTIDDSTTPQGYQTLEMSIFKQAIAQHLIEIYWASFLMLIPILLKFAVRIYTAYKAYTAFPSCYTNYMEAYCKVYALYRQRRNLFRDFCNMHPDIQARHLMSTFWGENTEFVRAFNDALNEVDRAWAQIVPLVDLTFGLVGPLPPIPEAIARLEADALTDLSKEREKRLTK